ncbi:spore maturation protein [candidate division KSB1 bacterium]|nr:spore maturation protein [candidate division KSB1 bacterium]
MGIREVIQVISVWSIPVIIAVIIVTGFIKKVKVYEVFVEGAKEGFEIAVKIIPFLVAILVAIGMFRESGAMDILVSIISPVTGLFGYPAEALPMAFMRPLSGSGSIGLMTELINTYGADSFIGRLASTMMGSTETTFYIVAVYFGSISIRKQRHTVAACLIADFVGLCAAFIICSIVF